MKNTTTKCTLARPHNTAMLSETTDKFEHTYAHYILAYMGDDGDVSDVLRLYGQAWELGPTSSRIYLLCYR